MNELLKKFIIVAQKDKLTEAANALHISQPALSEAIKNLERILGGKLLIRSKSGTTLTKFGKLVLSEALKVSKTYNNMLSVIADIKAKNEKTLRIGMIDNVALIALIGIYKDIVKEKLNIKLHLEINSTEKLIQSLINDQIDFAVTTKGLRQQKGLNIVDLGSEKMVMVSAPNFAKANSEMQNLAFVSYNQESFTHNQINNYFLKQKVNVNYIAFSSSPDFIKQSILNGIGSGMLPLNLVEKELKQKKLVIFKKKYYLYRRLILVNKTDTYINKISKQVIIKIKTLLSQNSRIKL